MTTAIVVQARMGSTRLPGKVLKTLAGRTVLAEVLRRCRAIPGADLVVCAIPEGDEDDALVAPAEREGARIVRGSAADVLARYRKAADETGATVVLRVTADCPLLDPALCAEVLALRARERADYVANNMPPGFPHGLDCEAFTAAALARADAAADTPYQREHVTPWLRTEPGIARAALRGPGGAVVRQRWTLDHPEDLAFLAAVFERLPAGATAWRDTLAIVDADPRLEAINAGRRAR